MKTLEDILQGVTPPETWRKIQCCCSDPICKKWYVLVPSRTDVWVKKQDAELILRAARNFAPLVRALQRFIEDGACVCMSRPNGGHEDPCCHCKAKDAINEALDDDP